MRICGDSGGHGFLSLWSNLEPKSRDRGRKCGYKKKQTSKLSSIKEKDVMQ